MFTDISSAERRSISHHDHRGAAEQRIGTDEVHADGLGPSPLNSVLYGHSSMTWFDRFRKPKPVVEDPTFGRLEYEKRHGCWNGSVPFRSQGESLLVTVYGEAPSETQRTRFREFEQRYGDLEPAIAVELFGLYEPHMDHPIEGMPLPASAQEMWKLMHLDGVELHLDGSLVVAYGFREGVGWDDAMFEVGFDGWTPVGKSLGD